MDSSRAAKLSKYFNSVIRGERTLKSLKDGELFIESLCGQSDPATSIEKLLSQPQGLESLQTCMRLDVSPKFCNGKALALFKYLQDPKLKVICAGEFLQRVIKHIVEPPIFWNAFVQSYRDGSLVQDAQQCFGWLLLELISLPYHKCKKYLEVAREPHIQNSLLNSPEFEVRTVGQKIKHVVSNFDPSSFTNDAAGPGGRHDNDSVNFREISIRPTADELTCVEPPYLPVADTVDSANGDDSCLALYLDHQFRVLREDMLGELREELLIMQGKKKGRHKGIVVDGFTIFGIDCGSSKRQPWGLQLQCTSDLRQLSQLKPKDRRAYLQENRNLLKHQSLACLVLDGEIAAFPTISRDIDLLEKKLPVILLQFMDESSTIKALLRLKTARQTRLVQIDTAIFSYEPILKRLQELNQLPLCEELLFWTAGSPVCLAPCPPTSLIETIAANPEQDLQAVLGSPRPIRLDASQRDSLVTGLRQSVSLIQGPPGTFYSLIQSF